MGSERRAQDKEYVWTCRHCRCDVRGIWIAHADGGEHFEATRGPSHESACPLHDGDDDAPTDEEKGR